MFPVGRIGRKMRERFREGNVAKEAPVFMAASLEYLCAELIEVAGETCL